MTYLVSGCVYLNPMVKTVPRPQIADSQKLQNIMPNLNAALNNIQVSANDLSSKRESNVTTSRVLNIATFGLATGAAGYGIKSGHISAIKNLGFLAGATYVSSTLFASNEQSLLYDTGFRALTCISQKGEFLNSLAMKIQSDIKSPTKYDCYNNQLKETLNNAYQTASDTLETIKNSDTVAAIQITTASQNVINTVNEQILKTSPNPDAILNAAKSLGSYSSPFVYKQIINATPKEKLQDSIDCTPQQNIQLTEDINNYNTMTKELTDALNNLASLKDTCQTSQLSIPDLAVSQSTLTIKQGQQFNIVISGGRPIYTAIQNPDNMLSLQVFGNTLVVTALKPYKKDDTVVVTVRDSSAIPSIKDITITYTD